MEYTKILFYIFAFWAIVTSLMTVFSRNTVKAALFLVWSFFSFAALWILLEAEFLSVILILVYVGAVMVLFLFVVKMLDIDKSTLRAKFTGYLPFGIVVSALIVVVMMIVFNGGGFDSIAIAKHQAASDYSNITDLASELYTKYVLQFELAAVILLIAIIAAISLVHRKNKDKKRQDIPSQIKINPKDRIKIIKIDNKNKDAE